MIHDLLNDVATGSAVVVVYFIFQYFKNKVAAKKASAESLSLAPPAAPTPVAVTQPSSIAPAVVVAAVPVAAVVAAATVESTSHVITANTIWNTGVKIDADLVSALHAAEKDGVAVEGTVQKYISSALTDVKNAL